MEWVYYKIKKKVVDKFMKENDDNSVIDLLAEGMECEQEDIEYIKG